MKRILKSKFMMAGFLMMAGAISPSAHATPVVTASLGPCQFEGQSARVKTGTLNSRRLDVSLQCQMLNGQLKQVLVTEWAGEDGNGIVVPIASADAFSDIQLYGGGSLSNDAVLSATAYDGATTKMVVGTYGQVRGDLDNCNGISCGGGNGG